MRETWPVCPQQELYRVLSEEATPIVGNFVGVMCLSIFAERLGFHCKWESFARGYVPINIMSHYPPPGWMTGTVQGFD